MLSLSMAQGRKVSMGCLFVLCTVVSAHAQTALPETGASVASEGGSQTSPSNIRHCVAISAESEGRTTDVFIGSGNVSPIGEQISRCASPSELAHQHVTEKLTIWQKCLKLDDWRISVVMTHRSDLKPKTLGGTRWDKPKKSAVIWVLDPSDYRLPFPEILDDIELTIVHELVHIKLAPLPRSEASRSSEEHAVNGIAEALLALARGKQ